MTDREALLAAVLEHPEDDTPRLIYADYLEEYGDAADRARSEFIRVQIELANLGKSVLPDGTVTQRTGCPDDDARERVLRRREEELFPLVRYRKALSVRGEREKRNGPTWGIHRGFVEIVRLPCGIFLQHAALIFAEQPVTEVTLTDKHPSKEGGWHNIDKTKRQFPDYQASYPHHIPESLWDLLQGGENRIDVWEVYFDKALARKALSDACVLFGRQAAREARTIPEAETA